MAISLWHLSKSLVRLTGCVVGQFLKLQSCRYCKFSSRKFRPQILRRDSRRPTGQLCAISTLEPLLNPNTLGSSQLPGSKEAHVRSGRQRKRKNIFTSLLISVPTAKQLSTGESGNVSFKLTPLLINKLYDAGLTETQFPHL